MSENVSVIGLGAMGRALAGALLSGGHHVTIWNRTPGRADALMADGAAEAISVGEALQASELIIVCVLDDAVVRDLITGHEDLLLGRTLVNLTTGTPGQARELARWSTERGISHLDGGIMAIPQMIGQPGASILYSGPATVFDEHRTVLDLLGASEWLGEDPGQASLYDLAMLAGMYAMFAGALQAMAMVGSAGGSVADLAGRLGPWLRAMTGSLPSMATMIDGDDFASDVQDLRFTRAALDTIVAASGEAGVATPVLRPILGLVEQQIAAGHGDEHFVRMYSGIGQMVTRP